MGLWDLHQELAIRDVRHQQAAAAEVIEGRQEQTKDDLYRVDDRIDRLLLLTEAVWELCAPQLGLTEDHLRAKVVEIDGRDGAVDGHRVRPARRCSQCDAAVPKDRTTCVFCGHAEPGSGAFDIV
jgi:hypothetical protein